MKAIFNTKTVTLRSALATGFVALATQLPVAAQENDPAAPAAAPAYPSPFPVIGRLAELPVYGKTIDRECFFTGGRGVQQMGRPGEWGEEHRMYTEKNIVQVIGNDCKRRLVLMNPYTLKPERLAVHGEVVSYANDTIFGATPIPQTWWQETGWLPARPQGEIGLAPRQKGETRCSVTLNGQMVVNSLFGRAVIIPDGTRAYELLKADDFKHAVWREGRNVVPTIQAGNCVLRPLITVPLPASPESSTHPYPVMTVLSSTNGRYFRDWLLRAKPKMTEGVVVYPSEPDYPGMLKDILDKSDVELGQTAKTGEKAFMRDMQRRQPPAFRLF